MNNFSIAASLGILDEDLADSVENRILDTAEFTTVLSATASAIPKIALCLVRISTRYMESEIVGFTHIGILRKNQRVATGQIRIKVTDITPLPVIDWDDIVKELSANLRSNVIDNPSKIYKSIPKETGKALFETLLKVYPEKEKRLIHLANKVSGPTLITTHRKEDIAVEKDATSLCLDIFGIDRSKIIGSWDIDDGLSGGSFLNGLTEYVVYEDDAISKDIHTFPGWKQIEESITGIVEFKNDLDERLVIINANRKPLEKALGVDLIYYHKKYEAFTFVQYKMMENRNEDKAIYYNPNQSSHTDELLRMENFITLLSKHPGSNSLLDYRFSDCPIFFKLCRKIELKSTDSSIVPGAYIPLNHWNILLNDSSVRGPKGGIQIGFHTLKKRYLGTQTFVDLVQTGLVGTNRIASKGIEIFIKAAIQDGHSVLLALDESKNDVPRRKY